MSNTSCSKQTTRFGAMQSLTLMLGLAMTLSAIHQAWAANITSCPITISQPGHYHVRTDLTCPTGTTPAISIEANDVQLHLNGHIIAGNGAGEEWRVEHVGPAAFGRHCVDLPQIRHALVGCR